MDVLIMLATTIAYVYSVCVLFALVTTFTHTYFSQYWRIATIDTVLFTGGSADYCNGVKITKKSKNVLWNASYVAGVRIFGSLVGTYSEGKDLRSSCKIIISSAARSNIVCYWPWHWKYFERKIYQCRPCSTWRHDKGIITIRALNLL